MTSIKHEGADGPAHTVHDAAFAELDAPTLYALLRLRVDVFVVEQNCAYPELDERDTEPDARHLWITAWMTADGIGPIAAYLRLLSDPDGSTRIGRVVTSPAARGAGLAAVLMRAALARAGDREVVLNAQAHLAHWYARFGFVRDGADYVEDDIPHVPMRRLPGAGA